jgi:exosortase
MGSLADPISFPLRLLVAKIVTVISQAGLGIDVVRDGTKLISGSGKFEYEVAAACAGLRSLIATVGLATIYAFLVFPKFWKRAVLILSAFPLAVVGNVFRMLTIVIAAELGGQQAGAYVHEGGPLGILSLLPYLPAFAGLLAIGWWLERSKTRTRSPREADAL